MKKLLVALLFSLFVVGVAYADCGHLTGQPFSIQIDEGVAGLSFSLGPFSGGCGGTAVMDINGADVGSFLWQEQAGGLIEVTGLGTFYYSDRQLIWIQGALVVLTAD